jgi:hypothetical protein
LSAARVALDVLRKRVVNGDTTVTAAQLAEAHAAIELEGLRAEAARRKAADPAEAERQARIAAGDAERRRVKERERVAERERWARDIDSGLTARHAAANVGPFSPEFEEFWREHDPEGWRRSSRANAGRR